MKSRFKGITLSLLYFALVGNFSINLSAKGTESKPSWFSTLSFFGANGKNKNVKNNNQSFFGKDGKIARFFGYDKKNEVKKVKPVQAKPVKSIVQQVESVKGSAKVDGIKVERQDLKVGFFGKNGKLAIALGLAKKPVIKEVKPVKKNLIVEKTRQGIKNLKTAWGKTSKTKKAVIISSTAGFIAIMGLLWDIFVLDGQFTGIGANDDGPVNKVATLKDGDDFENDNVDKEVKGKFDCPLCWDDKNKEDGCKLGCCGKVFCKKCLAGQIDVFLKDEKIDKNINNIKCPNVNCNNNKPIFSERVIREAFGDDKAKVERVLKLKRGLKAQTQPGYKHCPTRDCDGYFFNPNNEAHSRTCDDCHQTYCSRCLTNHREGRRCRFINRMTGRDKAWERATTKQCPNCNSRIEKLDGCNHMTCDKCRASFCWNCGFFTAPGESWSSARHGGSITGCYNSIIPRTWKMFKTNRQREVAKCIQMPFYNTCDFIKDRIFGGATTNNNNVTLNNNN